MRLMLDAGLASPGPRTGGTLLGLLGEPLCIPMLRAHSEGPLRLADLSELFPEARHTALSAMLTKLREVGALRREVRGGMPYTVENELTSAGHEALVVAMAVEEWLRSAPDGPIAVGSKTARAALRAWVSGWQATIVHALAAGPSSLTELSQRIAGISYPSLGRRLSAMRNFRQVEAVAGSRGSKPYFFTDWGRGAIRPIAVAARCEQKHFQSRSELPSAADVQTALLLAMGLTDRAGADDDTPNLDVALAVPGEGRQSIGVYLRLACRQSSARSFSGELDAGSWALASPDSWFGILAGDLPESLEFGGNSPERAERVVASLRVVLGHL